MRTTPKLRFHYDSSLGEGARVSSLIAEEKKRIRNALQEKTRNLNAPKAKTDTEYVPFRYKERPNIQ